MAFVPMTLTSGLALGVGATLLAGVSVPVPVAVALLSVLLGGSEKFGGTVSVRPVWVLGSTESVGLGSVESVGFGSVESVVLVGAEP